MTPRLRKLAFAMISPTLSAALLAGIIAENRQYLKPEDFEPYHVDAKRALEALPMRIGSWIGCDDPAAVPTAAQILLKPNKIISRNYTETSVDALSRPTGKVSLLIVQCKQSGDMVGHYPPNCYPSTGLEMIVKEERNWQVGDLLIPGIEYQFRLVDEEGKITITTVDNFLIVPSLVGGPAIFRDIKGVEQAAEDYQQRYYGAAQFQVVFQPPRGGDQLPRDERDRIFTTLMEPAVPVIRQLSTTLGPVSRTPVSRAESGAIQ